MTQEIGHQVGGRMVLCFIGSECITAFPHPYSPSLSYHVYPNRLMELPT